MISKVVVPIADQHIEHGATEELFQVLVDAAIGTLTRDEFRDIQVAAAWLVVVSLKQGHRGGVHPPTSRDAVKARYTKRTVPVGELFQS